MRILSPDFVGHFEGKIINIHHSFLPAFIGKILINKPLKDGLK